MSCAQEESSETIVAKASPTPAPTPNPTPNPNLTAQQRTFIVQMYKEAIMVNKLYEDAFEAKSENLFNKARGIGYAIVRRDEKNDEINDHDGINCWLYFMDINNSRVGQWFDYKNKGEVSDYTKESLAKTAESFKKCKSAAQNTGILNDKEMQKALPSIKPVEF